MFGGTNYYLLNEHPMNHHNSSPHVTPHDPVTILQERRKGPLAAREPPHLAAPGAAVELRQGLVGGEDLLTPGDHLGERINMDHIWTTWRWKLEELEELENLTLANEFNCDLQVELYVNAM